MGPGLRRALAPVSRIVPRCLLTLRVAPRWRRALPLRSRTQDVTMVVASYVPPAIAIAVSFPITVPVMVSVTVTVPLTVSIAIAIVIPIPSPSVGFWYVNGTSRTPVHWNVF